MNRRTFLSSLNAFKGERTLQARPAAAVPAITPSLEPYGGPWNRRTIAHLLRRTLTAPTYAEMQTASAMSMEDLVAELTAVPSASAPAPGGWCGDVINAAAGLPWYDNRFDLNDAFLEDLRRWWFGVMTNGGMSVRERMTLFWHNHFATNATVIRDPRLMYLQNQLFRRHALGSFRDLVRDVTIDKAMLIFLDGRYNKRDHERNENYARELQELFTIGIADNDGNPNYTQQDVVEVARAVSGWDWLGDGLAGEVDSLGDILYRHDDGDKTIYGQALKGSYYGKGELETLLDIIFAREETARYVIRKLYRFFVHTDAVLTPISPIAPEVEEHIIAPLAAEFRASNWNVAVVLRRLFSSRHFYEADIIGSNIKSPVDLFTGTLRATRVGALAGDRGEFLFQHAHQRSETLGQILFNPPGVQGWQFHRSWISTTTLPQRHAYTDEMIEGAKQRITDRAHPLFPDALSYRNGTAQIDVLSFARQFPSFDDPEELIADIADHLLAYPPSESLLRRLKEELVGERDYEWSDAPDELKRSRLRAMLRYLTRSTNYQLM